MALPNTIILGAQKAGTTSLFDWISQHPDVYGEPGMKDFPFFIKDEYYEKGLNWFNNRFKKHRDEKIVLHGCVNYMYFCNEFIDRINSYPHETKFIVVLRNPIERAYSAYWFNRKIGVEKALTFEEALNNEYTESFKSLKEIGSFTYLDHGYYYRQLSYLLKHIDKTKLLVLLFDDIVHNNLETIKKVYNFLNISDNYVPDFSKKNQSGIPYNSKLQKILSGPLLNKKLKFIKNIIPIEKRIILKHKIQGLNTKPFSYPPIQEKTRDKISIILRSDINKLESLISQDLSSWKL